MKIQIDTIKIGNRIRKDIGNIDELAQSIFELGLINPITVSEQMELIAGYRRLMACKKLGHEEIEARVMDLDPKTEIDENNIRKEFTVSERVQAAQILELRERWKAAERAGYRSDLNRTGELPHKEYPESIPAEFGRATDFVAQKTGFGSGRNYEKAKTVIQKAEPELIEKLDQGKISIHSAYVAVKKQEEVNKRQAEVEEIQSYDGLYCGDCLTELRNVPNESVDCLIIDPPYGIDFVSNKRKYDNDVTVPVANDTQEAAIDLLYDSLAVVDAKLKPNSHAYIFCSWKTYPEFKLAIQKYLTIRNVLVWSKGGIGMGDIYNNYGESYELIIFASKGNRSLLGQHTGNILHVNKVSDAERDHSCQKPVELLKILIEKSTIEGETVLDYFAGTGSTLLAAREVGRKWIGIELKQENIEKIKAKLRE